MAVRESNFKTVYAAKDLYNGSVFKARSEKVLQFSQLAGNNSKYTVTQGKVRYFSHP